jgi:hypothetical protein
MTGLVTFIIVMVLSWVFVRMVIACVCAYRRGLAKARTEVRDLPVLAQAKPDRVAADEAVLLGPVSAWVAEGEARAVREWERKRPDPKAEPPADIFDIRMTTIRS